MGGGANVLEDEIISKLDGDQVGSGDRILSFAIGGLISGNDELLDIAKAGFKNRGFSTKEIKRVFNQIDDTIKKDYGQHRLTLPNGKSIIASGDLYAGWTRNLDSNGIKYKDDYLGTQGGFIAGPFATSWNDQTTPKFSSLIDKKPRFEIDDSEAKIFGDFGYAKKSISEPYYTRDGRQEGTTLRSVLIHHNLYKQYPFLNEIKVISGNNGGASYNSKTNEIAVDFSVIKDKKQLKSVLLHEIQHAIQNREGFATGGSPTDFKVKNAVIDDMYRQRKEWAGDDFDNWSLELLVKNKSKYSALLKEGEKYLKSDPSRAMEPFYKEFVKTLPEDQRDIFIRRMVDIDREIAKIGTKQDPLSSYKRLAGELEARAVQRRIDLPQDQRLRTDPYAEEAIVTTGKADPRQFIARFDNGTSQSTNKAPKLPKQDLDLANEAKDFKSSKSFVDYKFNDWMLKEQQRMVNGGEAESIFQAGDKIMESGRGESVYNQMKRELTQVWNNNKSPITRNTIKPYLDKLTDIYSKGDKTIEYRLSDLNEMVLEDIDNFQRGITFRNMTPDNIKDYKKIGDELIKKIELREKLIDNGAIKSERRFNVDGVKSTLNDLYNLYKKQLSSFETKPTETNLINEARKYKSAEEFVKAQGDIVYHGGTVKSVDDVITNDNKAFYVTKDKDFAQDFADDFIKGKMDSGGKEVLVSDFIIKPEAKILTRKNLPKQFLFDYEGGTLSNLSDLKKYGGSQGLQDSAQKWARNKGYDVLDWGGEQGNELIVLNKNVLQTKSQLIDIWNKANKTNADDALIQEARKYKSAEEFVKAKTNAYHGTASGGDITELKPSSGGELGRGAYFSRDPNVAKKYGTPDNRDIPRSKFATVPLDLTDLKFKEMTKQEFLDLRNRYFDEQQAPLS